MKSHKSVSELFCNKNQKNKIFWLSCMHGPDWSLIAPFMEAHVCDMNVSLMLVN